MLEGMVELNKFLVDDQVIKKNRFRGITEMSLNLNELDNSDNSLLTYHVTSNEDFTRFKTRTPQYKRVKDGEFTSLTLRITD